MKKNILCILIGLLLAGALQSHAAGLPRPGIIDSPVQLGAAISERYPGLANENCIFERMTDRTKQSAVLTGNNIQTIEISDVQYDVSNKKNYLTVTYTFKYGIPYGFFTCELK